MPVEGNGCWNHCGHSYDESGASVLVLWHYAMCAGAKSDMHLAAVHMCWSSWHSAMCGWGKFRHALGCGPRVWVLLALCDVCWGIFSHACTWPWSTCAGAMDDGVQQHMVVAMR
eukprot:14827734-Alexandrium_andersonii.AAC.1